MALKRISDLSVVQLDDNLNNLNEKTYRATDNTLIKSLFEISWNIEPLEGHKYESKAITLEALSSVFTYQILNKDISFSGNKIFKDTVYFDNHITANANATFNGNITQTGIYSDLNLNNTNGINVSTKNISLTAINSSIETTPIKTLSATTLTLKFNGENNQIYNSGNNLYIKYGTSLTITNGSKTMLYFNGDSVSAYGNWKFLDSTATSPITGYINHALYS